MKHLLLLFFFSISVLSFGQKKDTIFFDKNWKPCTKENYVFYRPLPLKEIGELVLIQDFYKNGIIQMQGYVYKNDEKKYVGDVFWYNQNGFDNSFTQYLNSTNLELKYYYPDGKLWKTIAYEDGIKNGKTIIYDNTGEVLLVENYDKGNLKLHGIYSKFISNYYSDDFFNGKKYTKENNENRAQTFTYKKRLFWLDSKKIAQELTYENHNGYDKIISEIDYDNKGNIVQSLSNNDFYDCDEQKSGKEYFYQTQNGFVKSFKIKELQAQQGRNIKLQNVSLLKLSNNNDIEFYKEKNGKLTEIDCDIIHEYNEGGSLKGIFFKSTDYENKEYTIEEIKKDKEKILLLEDIKSQPIEDLLKEISEKEWVVENESFKENESKSKEVYKMFNSQIFMLLHYDFTDNKSYGFGSHIESADDDIKKFRVKYCDFLNYYILTFAENKHIICLFDTNGNIRYSIIPTKNGLVVNFAETLKENKIDTNWKNNADEMEQILRSFIARDFYILKSENHLQVMSNVFGEKLIPETYDSLSFKGFFVAGKKKGKIDIYNLMLEKLPLNNVKQIYSDYYNLQILQNNEVKYINVKGKNTAKNIITYIVCGTGSSTNYYNVKTSSITDKYKNVYKIVENYTSYLRIKHTIFYTLFLTNLSVQHKIFFLNNKPDFTYYTAFNPEKYLNSNYLLVFKNAKFGLYKISDTIKYQSDEKYVNPADTKVKYDDSLYFYEEKRHDSLYYYAEDKARQILPIVYDSITYEDNLIFLKKDNLIGIFPLQKKVKYKSVGKRNTNFIEYELSNGQKGWLDLNTGIEYNNE